MRSRDLFAKTNKSAPKQDSINAYLLTKAGYISQVAAGVYAYLPLAVRSMKKIEAIIREEMNAIGGSEVVFSALQPKQTWEISGRWKDKSFREIVYFDEKAEMTFGATHEEPMAIAVKQFVQSYRDLPVILYQFQTKFRHELRPKSGLLRGREFRMKDLYSFHPDEKSHHQFYEEAAQAYLRVFKRLGLEVYRVKASGGIFAKKLSDEFQVLCQSGEDEVLIDRKTKTGFNKEIEADLKEADKKKFERVKAIEVGNIFHLGTKYTDAFDVRYLDASGKLKSIYMGSYGIGISRLLGTLAEINNDENGLRLPVAVAPFQIHLIDLTDSGEGGRLEKTLEKLGFEVYFDDRDESPGTKFVDADLIGLPVRLVYSAKTAQEGKVELKQRQNGKLELVKIDELPKRLTAILS